MLSCYADKQNSTIKESQSTDNKITVLIKCIIGNVSTFCVTVKTKNLFFYKNQLFSENSGLFMSFMLFCSDIIFLVCSQFIKLWPIIKFCELRIILSVKHKWRDVLKVYFVFLIKKDSALYTKKQTSESAPNKKNLLDEVEGALH